MVSPGRSRLAGHLHRAKSDQVNERLPSLEGVGAWG